MSQISKHIVLSLESARDIVTPFSTGGKKSIFSPTLRVCLSSETVTELSSLEMLSLCEGGMYPYKGHTRALTGSL